MKHVFSSVAKDGTTITHAVALSHVVLKIGKPPLFHHSTPQPTTDTLHTGRRTVAPARALAMSGYGPAGEANWQIFSRLNNKQRQKFLIGENEELGVVVGSEEMNMQDKGNWPGAI